jgi:hypothetical protein
MAEPTQVVDELLAPGDLVDVEYLIQPGAAPGLVTLAIHDIKRSLAADERFHYQGSWTETRVDKTGQFGGVIDVEFLIVRVQVADPSKRKALPDGYEPQPQWNPERQEAGIPRLSVKSVVALFSAAIAAHAAAVTIRTYTLHRLATSTAMNDETKQAALNAFGKGGSSIGQAIALISGSLGTAAIIIAVLWALSLSSRRGGVD